MSGKRRFFSGTSESQAAIEAAAALGVPVTALAYRLVDKRGALRPGRVVIEVDPDNPRRAETPVAAAATSAGVAPAGPQPPQRQPPPSHASPRDGGPVRQPRRDDGDGPGWSSRPGREAGGEEVVLAVASAQPSESLSGEAGAAEATRALGALAALEIEPRVELLDDTVQVDLTGAAAPRLVERQGELLRTFEYLLRRMVRELPEGGLVADSGGYRVERETTLRRRAVAAAEAVRSSGEPVIFEPLPAAERRIVHVVVQDEPGVASASEGEGEAKRLRVFRAP